MKQIQGSDGDENEVDVTSTNIESSTSSMSYGDMAIGVRKFFYNAFGKPYLLYLRSFYIVLHVHCSQLLVMPLSRLHSFHGLALPNRRQNKVARSSIGPKEYLLLVKPGGAKRSLVSRPSALSHSPACTKHFVTQRPHPVLFLLTE